MAAVASGRRGEEAGFSVRDEVGERAELAWRLRGVQRELANHHPAAALEKLEASLERHRNTVAELQPLVDLEKDFGLTEGNIFHGELSVEQLFHQRPAAGWARARPPLPGILLPNEYI